MFCTMGYSIVQFATFISRDYFKTTIFAASEIKILSVGVKYVSTLYLFLFFNVAESREVVNKYTSSQVCF